MKLLHVLQTGEVTRLGGIEARSVDVCVIAATKDGCSPRFEGAI